LAILESVYLYGGYSEDIRKRNEDAKPEISSKYGKSNLLLG